MNISRFWYSKGTGRLPHVGACTIILQSSQAQIFYSYFLLQSISCLPTLFSCQREHTNPVRSYRFERARYRRKSICRCCFCSSPPYLLFHLLQMLLTFLVNNMSLNRL